MKISTLADMIALMQDIHATSKQKGLYNGFDTINYNLNTHHQLTERLLMTALTRLTNAYEQGKHLEASTFEELKNLQGEYFVERYRQEAQGTIEDEFAGCATTCLGLANFFLSGGMDVHFGRSGIALSHSYPMLDSEIPLVMLFCMRCLVIYALAEEKKECCFDSFILCFWGFIEAAEQKFRESKVSYTIWDMMELKLKYDKLCKD